MTQVFGRVHLGYVVIESEKLSDWQRFGTDAIGMHLDRMDADTLRFRMDEHACRFVVRRGPAEDVVAVGWQIDDHPTFDEIIGRVTGHGVPVTEASCDDAAVRGVERLWRFPGPKGLVQEVFTTPISTPQPLDMLSGGFVTGADGLGHIAMTTTKPAELRGYYNAVFDARLSDYIDETINRVKMKIRFLRVNRRHHSIALVSTHPLATDPFRTRIQHLNIQTVALDDMVASYQRISQSGFRLALGIGQHTNDKELSYYAMTPSGFEWEVGWNPIVVDERTWQPTTHQGISIWGHTPVGQTVLEKLALFRNAALSLRDTEDPVDALSGAGIRDD